MYFNLTLNIGAPFLRPKLNTYLNMYYPYSYICSAQLRNLHSPRIVLHIFLILLLHSNLNNHTVNQISPYPGLKSTLNLNKFRSSQLKLQPSRAPGTHCLGMCGSPGFSGKLENYCIRLCVVRLYIIGTTSLIPRQHFSCPPEKGSGQLPIPF